MSYAPNRRSSKLERIILFLSILAAIFHSFYFYGLSLEAQWYQLIYVMAPLLFFSVIYRINPQKFFMYSLSMHFIVWVTSLLITGICILFQHTITGLIIVSGSVLLFTILVAGRDLEKEKKSFYRKI